MNHQKFKNIRKLKRKRRVRQSVTGDSERPRLSVFRSLRHIYAQIIDDDNGVTVVSASTLSKDLADREKSGGNKDAAALVGENLARKAIAVGVRQVRFDRNGYKYHGRIRVLAESARKSGLVF